MRLIINISESNIDNSTNKMLNGFASKSKITYYDSICKSIKRIFPELNSCNNKEHIIEKFKHFIKDNNLFLN